VDHSTASGNRITQLSSSPELGRLIWSRLKNILLFSTFSGNPTLARDRDAEQKSKRLLE
jgi:hypothetical protein